MTPYPIVNPRASRQRLVANLLRGGVENLFFFIWFVRVRKRRRTTACPCQKMYTRWYYSVLTCVHGSKCSASMGWSDIGRKRDSKTANTRSMWLYGCVYVRLCCSSSHIIWKNWIIWLSLTNKQSNISSFIIHPIWGWHIASCIALSFELANQAKWMSIGGQQNGNE